MKKQTRKIASIAAAALIALSVSVLPAANENAALPSAAITVSAASSAPKAPSKDYTGFSKEGSDTYFFENGKLKKGGLFTYEGKKYYANKDGTLLKNDWKNMKSGKYYYANNKCVVTVYEIKNMTYTAVKYKGYVDEKKETWKAKMLLINGEKAKWSDICSYNKIYGIFKISNRYYNLKPDSPDSSNWQYDEFVRVSEDVGEDFYDVLTKKELQGVEKGVGDLKADSNGLVSGKFFNMKTGEIWTIKGKKGVTDKKPAGKIVLGHKSNTYYKVIDVNSAGGVSIRIYAYNNTGKKIKYVTYTVYFTNRVNDILADEITGNKYFNIITQGPYDNGSNCGGSWENVMYNNWANDYMVSSVKVDFMDGTSATYSSSQIDYTFFKWE